MNWIFKHDGCSVLIVVITVNDYEQKNFRNSSISENVSYVIK